MPRSIYDNQLEDWTPGAGVEYLRKQGLRLPEEVSSIFTSVSEAQAPGDDGVRVESTPDQPATFTNLLSRLAQTGGAIGQQIATPIIRPTVQQATEEAVSSQIRPLYYVLGAAAIGGAIWYFWLRK